MPTNQIDAHPPDMSGPGLAPAHAPTADDGRANRRYDWRAMLGSRNRRAGRNGGNGQSSDTDQDEKRARWNMGILNDPDTDQVPGTVLLMSKASEYNRPLGLGSGQARKSTSSLHSGYRSHSRASSERRTSRRAPEVKKTRDGKFVLEPQPGDSANDPLNWHVWRRDASLFSLGFYCMLGGGMTPILAAGFGEVAQTYDVSVPQVALTTGLYMLGLGLGSVVLSPTAIIYGKRPVYLGAAVCFVLSAIWCAASPNFPSLICARIFQGFAVSSVECLPSATIAEIYFLHEKGYRLGIYTLLLLSGKNLVPLVSAVIIESLGWRWVFWIVAMVVGFAGILLFFFVPESFWDRSPRPKRRRRSRSKASLRNRVLHPYSHPPASATEVRPHGDPEKSYVEDLAVTKESERHAHFNTETSHDGTRAQDSDNGLEKELGLAASCPPIHAESGLADSEHEAAEPKSPVQPHQDVDHAALEASEPSSRPRVSRTISGMSALSGFSVESDPRNEYTRNMEAQPKLSYHQQLRFWSGRIASESWFKAALRPFILFAYPNILWSTLIYSLSIGWLIVLSESVSTIFEARDTYNFTSLQAGLIYISPFIGGVLGTAVAGKCSDILVRYMARRNGGIYEPEFRLVMAIPIALTTVIGLMGYGWSVEERDSWIVPTVFFGIISFGCALGSTTSITFAVDSYRQYAGEALVTLNFSKNILHGLVWSLFFNSWLDRAGSRTVFLAIGGIQLVCLGTTIPVYIYGKRARMWTTRRNLMEKF